MLSTPPAFILSQDQTLVKSVCLGQESLLAILFLLLFGLFQTVLKNLLLRNFQGSVVYCSVIKVLCFPLSVQATALIDYHIVSCLSTTFSSSFIQPRCLPPDDPGSHLLILCTFTVSRTKHPLCIPAAAKPPVCKSFVLFLSPQRRRLSLPSSPLIVNVFLFLFISCNSDNNRISRF